MHTFSKYLYGTSSIVWRVSTGVKLQDKVYTLTLNHHQIVWSNVLKEIRLRACPEMPLGWLVVWMCSMAKCIVHFLAT